jgi:multidrug efflux system membrane fusion protein
MKIFSTFFRNIPSATIFGILALPLCSCNKAEEGRPPEGARPVKLFTVESLPFHLEREFPGTVRAMQSVELSFRVSGRLTQLPTESLEVRKGDVLAAIDSRDYETNLLGIEAQIAQAEAKLVALRAGARPEDRIRLEAAVKAREAEKQEVEVREARYRILLAEGAVSQQEYDTIKAQLDVALSNLEASQKELEIGIRGAREEDIRAQEAAVSNLQALRKQAMDAIEDTKLLAPFDGQVSVVYPNNFEEVQAKQPVLKFQDVSQLQIAIDISERDMAVGASLTLQEITETILAKATFVGLPGREFPLRVYSFETTADPLTQTFEVTFVMDQPKDEGAPVLPGMNAVIRSKRSPRANEIVGLYVPASAVFGAPDGSKRVWAVQEGRAVSTVVSGNEIVQGSMRITEGLKPGDTIAISAIATLVEGQQVRQMPDLARQ